MPQIQMGKRVKNRCDAGDYVVSSAKTNAESVGADIEVRWGVIAGFMAGFLVKVIQWFAGILEGSGKKLKQKELDYVAELADDIEPRKKRDEASAAAWNLIGSARSRIEQLQGDEGLKTYGLWEPVLQSPSEVAHRLTTTIEFLDKNPVTTADPFGAVFDSTVVVDKLRAALATLNEALAKVLTEERERQDALNARDLAIEEWALAYQGVASILSGLFLLAGRTDLSERLKPTIRRISGQEEVPIDETTTAPAEGGE